LTVAQEFTADLTAPRRVRAPTRLHDRILHVVLFITVLASSVAFIEPSPHDALMLVLALACLIAGVRFERNLLPLLALLVIWNVGGLLSLFYIADQEKAIQYIATSFYLAIAALVFACLFAEDSMRRLSILRAAYIATAIGATLFGLAAYLHLFPGSSQFVWADRARATFKDPNVFGPFLILPALFLIERMVADRIRLGAMVATLILLTGLLLSYSRGAWLNFTLSTTVLLALLVLTAPTQRARMRPIVLGLVSAAGLALALIALSTIDAVREMLMQRAQLVQPYDVGSGGRFVLQELAINVLFDHPFGLGPFEFSRIYGLQQHNVYLQAFLVYGWLGGVTFIALMLVTLFLGLRNALIRTPWQFYLIAAYAAFVGIVFESAVIDSDHWRHLYLILGMIWGMSAATIKFTRNRQTTNAVPAAWVQP